MGLETSKSRGQIIQTVKYADDLVLMAKEETVLQGMIDKLIETGRYYGMEINVEKTKVMRISRQPSPITIMIDQKQLENVKLNPGLPWQKLHLTRRRIFLPANWT